MRPPARLVAAAIAPMFAPLVGGCARALDGWVADAVSAPASAVAARGGADPMPGDPQTLMTRPGPARPGDRARADTLVRALRIAIAPYRDVARAERDGYRSFPPAPGPDVRLVHYVHRARSAAEGTRVDPARPGALLYEQVADSTPRGAAAGETRAGGRRLRLVGAMFTAPVGAAIEELDRRVPLSVTRWHLHQNVCVPRPLWDAAAWARRAADGRPAFGPGSPTATAAACDALGGRFLPTVFGWMAHAYVYAPDPADTWNAMYGHAPGHAHASGHPPP